jgi:hypothetical protein
MDSNVVIPVLFVLVVVLLAALAWMLYQQHLSKKLADRFGPEYKRTVQQLGSKDKAESELRARAERVEHLRIVPLSQADCARFSHAWEALQASFVDDPKRAIAEADRLVREVMMKRGYPMGDFDRRAADISVDHPMVVDHYRAAQEIAARDARAQASTEELRKAIVHYRALFDDLLKAEAPAPRPAAPNRIQRA